MELIFLGTSSGTPTKTRNVSAVAIRRANSKAWCLVDCGEGTQHQVLHTSLSLNNLQAIFITHVHGDHCYGLPGLLASAGMAGRQEPLWIIGPPEIKTYFDAVQKTTQLWLPYQLEFKSVTDIEGMLLHNKIDFDIEVVPLSHRVPSYAYGFSEKETKPGLDAEKLREAGIPQGPLWGNIQQGQDVVLPDGREIIAKEYWLPTRKPRKIIIAGDNDTPTLLTTSAKTADVVVHESTHTGDVALKMGDGPQHSSAKIVAEFAHESRIKNLILTHISPRYQENRDTSPSIADIEAEAKSYYHGNLFVANDFDVFHLNKKGALNKL